MVIVYDIINIEKSSLSLRKKAIAKWYKKPLNTNNLSLWKHERPRFYVHRMNSNAVVSVCHGQILKAWFDIKNSLLESNNETQVPMDNQIPKSDEKKVYGSVVIFIEEFC